MPYGDATLKRGDNNAQVAELQMRLAGFRGTVPDGDYGPGTELQVISFQRDVMGQAAPTGQADLATLQAIDAFGRAHPIDFGLLRCDCQTCTGYGQGKFKGLYANALKNEMYYRYEYPGVHRMLLWAYRAAQHYARRNEWTLTINSGYRCSVDNQKNGRSSTNHHGKAIDVDVLNPRDKRQDVERSNALRGLLVSTANAQIGWGAANRKSLEPENIAPTWVHYDVRNYERKYLDDRYFVRTLAELDAAPAGV